MTKPKSSKSASKEKSTEEKSADQKNSIRAEHWKDEPDEHDYPAAGDFLSLLVEPVAIPIVIASLRMVGIERRKAKDILRASRLPLLPQDNPHVAIDLNKVRDGEKLSPVLLLRGSIANDVALCIADGYHRVCASCHLDENADIPCRIANFPK